MIFHVFTALLMAGARPSYHAAWQLQVLARFQVLALLSHFASFVTLHNMY